MTNLKTGLTIHIPEDEVESLVSDIVALTQTKTHHEYKELFAARITLMRFKRMLKDHLREEEVAP